MRAELYRFTQGSEVWTFTSGEQAIDHGGETYVPATIGRGQIDQRETMDRSTLEVRVPRDNAVAVRAMAAMLKGVVGLTVMRVEPSVLVLWRGRLAAARAAGSEVILEGEPIFTSLRRLGLRAKYQRPCRHALYGRGCNVSQAAFEVAAEVTGGTELSIEFSVAGDPLPDGWFTGGILEDADGNLRFIARHVGNTLTLNWPLDGVEATDPITLSPGCNRTRAHCGDKFDNLDNYGGFPWMPLTNPFGGRSIV
jgi:uncharacterized phage protein (TIGR02218 family)